MQKVSSAHAETALLLLSDAFIIHETKLEAIDYDCDYYRGG